MGLHNPKELFDFRTQMGKKCKTVIHYSSICPTEYSLHVSGLKIRIVIELYMKQHVLEQYFRDSSTSKKVEYTN